MKLHTVFAAALALTGAVPSQAVMVNDTTTFAAFSLNYDAGTTFTGLDFNGSGGGGFISFGWDVATTVLAVNSSATFALPSFTITAKPGWFLSGPVGASLGNLAFAEFGLGATSSASASGSVSVDGGPIVVSSGPLIRTVTSTSPVLSVGYYANSTAIPAGTFNTFDFSSGSLALSASGGSGSAAVFAQGQSKLEFSLIANPVPEPETAALLVAGLLTLGSLARRRSRG